MAEKSRGKTKGSVIVKIVGVVLCVILIPILVINLTLIVKSFVYPDKVPSFLGYKPFIVLSGSMEPEFYAGDLVVVRERPAESLEEGEIIAFRQGDSVTTHRILQITARDGQRSYITKGDNNNIEDKIPVTGDMVEGVYLLRVSGLGNAAIFMQTPTGMILFIAVPLILFILYDISRRRYYERREKRLTTELQQELDRMSSSLQAQKTTARTPQNELY